MFNYINISTIGKSSVVNPSLSSLVCVGERLGDIQISYTTRDLKTKPSKDVFKIAEGVVIKVEGNQITVKVNQYCKYYEGFICKSLPKEVQVLSSLVYSVKDDEELGSFKLSLPSVTPARVKEMYLEPLNISEIKRPNTSIEQPSTSATVDCEDTSLLPTMPSSSKLFTVGCIDIYQNDLDSLLPQAWINDNIINAYGL